jgi:hypothetical protein
MGPLESTIGFLLSGVLFTTFMFGIVTVQTYIYFSTFRNDRRILKWLVRPLPLSLALSVQLLNNTSPDFAYLVPSFPTVTLCCVKTFVRFLELGTMLCISIGTYTIFVTNFGHPERLARNPDPMNSAVLVGGLVDHLVKVLFIPHPSLSSFIPPSSLPGHLHIPPL